MNIPEIAQMMVREYEDASREFGAFHNAHEGWGVLREEYLELEDEIRKKHHDKTKMRHEAIQVGAMAMRLIFDVCNAPDNT